MLVTHVVPDDESAISEKDVGKAWSKKPLLQKYEHVPPMLSECTSLSKVGDQNRAKVNIFETNSDDTSKSTKISFMQSVKKMKELVSY